VGATTARRFVIGGQAVEGGLVEVMGALGAGDKIVRRGAGEVHEGNKL